MRANEIRKGSSPIVGWWFAIALGTESLDGATEAGIVTQYDRIDQRTIGGRLKSQSIGTVADADQRVR